MKNRVGETGAPNRRTVYLNDRTQNQSTFKYFLNDIKTSKYSWWNFFPKSLILQFMRAANLYFLISTVISCISIVSSIEPFTAIFPLVLVLSVSLSREAVEDYKRHRNDDLVNEQKTSIFNNKNFTSIMWKDVQIGDIIKVSCEQVIPADIVLITSNEENGTGYVETSNLDGERNLKCKIAQENINQYGREIPLTSLKGRVVCEPPNNNIHFFKGILYLDTDPNPIMLSNTNVMLRGTTLKNTDWVIGLVVYSGKDTKMMKNQGQVKHKSTHIERIMNPIILLTLVIQSGLCLCMAILGAQFQEVADPSHWYIYGLDSSNSYSVPVAGMINYFTYFLLLNTLIPISLIISLEVVKLFQSGWLEYDIHMHHTLSDGSVQKMKVLNTLIHEELGKIEYIFTDKTGTLTSNTMIFRHANISGTDYTEKEVEEILSKQEFSTLTMDEDYRDFYNFWLCIAICHDVLMEKKNEGVEVRINNNGSLNAGISDEKDEIDTDKKKDHALSYHGSSPDEVCLVEAAARYNFKFFKRTTNQIFIKIGSEMVTFRLLHSIEFSSERKRMSVIAQDMQTDKIYVFTKGADSFIMKNISTTTEALKHNIKNSLKNYSRQGLRTLCLGMREIDANYFNDWMSRYQKLQFQTVGGVNPEEIQKQMSQMESELETNIDLLGVTALEDKLQDGVPEVLQEIHEAGINVWMLTGDKLETAENIGYLCNLLNNNTKIFRVQSSHEDVSRDKFFRIKGRISEIKTMSDIGEIRVRQKSGQDAPAAADVVLETEHIGKMPHRPPIQQKSSLAERKDSMEFNQQHTQQQQDGQNAAIKPYTGFALIIEGEAIGHALTDEMCRKEFLAIIQECSAVICCRSTPTQKAQVVNFVKHHFKKTCLAIGDGGNDVTMIQEADIGVGIIGKEGNQAALNSDYYFGQFRFLSRLLFVHGRWTLFRTSYFMNYFFLKNAIFTMQQFLFGFYCGKSGQTIWEDGYLMNFNSIVTACAPVYYAAFEQDVNPHGSEYIAKYLPRLYKIYRAKKLFSYTTFSWQMIIGSIASVAIYYSIQEINSDAIIASHGRIDGMWYQSMMAYCTTVGVVWAINFMDTRYFTLWTLFAYLPASVMLYFPTFAFIWDKFSGPMQYLLISFIGNLKFWLPFLLIVGVTYLIKYLTRVYYYMYKPDLIHDLEIHRSALNQKLSSMGQHDQIVDHNAIMTPANSRHPVGLEATNGATPDEYNKRNGGAGGGVFMQKPLIELPKFNIEEHMPIKTSNNHNTNVTNGHMNGKKHVDFDSSRGNLKPIATQNEVHLDEAEHKAIGLMLPMPTDLLNEMEFQNNIHQHETPMKNYSIPLYIESSTGKSTRKNYQSAEPMQPQHQSVILPASEPSVNEHELMNFIANIPKTAFKVGGNSRGGQPEINMFNDGIEDMHSVQQVSGYEKTANLKSHRPSGDEDFNEIAINENNEFQQNIKLKKNGRSMNDDQDSAFLDKLEDILNRSPTLKHNPMVGSGELPQLRLQIQHSDTKKSCIVTNSENNLENNGQFTELPMIGVTSSITQRSQLQQMQQQQQQQQQQNQMDNQPEGSSNGFTYNVPVMNPHKTKNQRSNFSNQLLD